MEIKGVIVMFLILTLTTYYVGGANCTAFEFDTYFLKGERAFPQNIPELSEIVYVPKRNAIYFQFADTTVNNNTKIGMLLYDKNSVTEKIAIDKTITFAYDDILDIIYVGTKKGMYAVDFQNHVSETPIKDSIISVFVQNSVIYFINSDNEVIVCETDGISYKIDLLDLAKLTRLVVINKKDMVGITENLDIMTLSHDNGLLFYNTDELGLPINLLVDNNIIYVFTSKGVYKMDSKGGLARVSSLPNLQALAFVNDTAVIIGHDGVIAVWRRYNENPCLG